MGSERSTRIAVIVAAGSGTRFGAKKQFINVGGKPLYYYSIEKFKPLVDYVVLVVPNEDICKINSYGTIVIPGGETRQQSVFNAIVRTMEIKDERIDKNSIVLIHDGVRPAIKEETINRVIREAEKYDAVIPVISISDTVRTIDGEIVDRSNLKLVQTPQAFRLGILKQAYERLIILPQKTQDDLRITDDAQVVQQLLGIKPYYCDGDPSNIKVTVPEDVGFLNIY